MAYGFGNHHGEARPDEKMGRQFGRSSRQRKVMQRSAAKKRRQRSKLPRLPR